jgi:hypothetical protein
VFLIESTGATREDVLSVVETALGEEVRGKYERMSFLKVLSRADREKGLFSFVRSIDDTVLKPDAKLLPNELSFTVARGITVEVSGLNISLTVSAGYSEHEYGHAIGVGGKTEVEKRISTLPKLLPESGSEVVAQLFAERFKWASKEPYPGTRTLREEMSRIEKLNISSTLEEDILMYTIGASREAGERLQKIYGNMNP